MKWVGLWLGWTLVAGSGCSALFVQPLPVQPTPSEVIVCTTSTVAPAIDTGLATTNIISALYVASSDKVVNKSAAITLGLSVAAVWAASAYYGYSRVSECEAAQRAASRFPVQSWAPASPPVLPPPPTTSTPGGPGLESPPLAPAPALPVRQQRDDDDPG